MFTLCSAFMVEAWTGEVGEFTNLISFVDTVDGVEETWASVTLYSADGFFQLEAVVKYWNGIEYFRQTLDFGSVTFPHDWLQFCLTIENSPWYFKVRLAAKGKHVEEYMDCMHWPENSKLQVTIGNQNSNGKMTDLNIFD